MKLNTIEMKGFCSYKDYNFFNIPMGVTGIVGSINNEDGKSNGSGKSASIMSLLFALYGSGSFNRIEEIWNDALNPTEDAFVKVNFSLMGNNYIIERGRKGKTGTYLDVFENGNRCDESIKIKDAQEFINNLLGMEEKLFTSSVFFSQGDLASFIETEPSKRREYIDSLLNLEIWRNAYKKSTSDYKKKSDLLELKKANLLEKEKELVTSLDEIKSLQEGINLLPIYEKQKKEKSIELEKIKNLKNTQNTIDDYENLQKSNAAELSNSFTRKSALDKNLEDLEDRYKKEKVEFINVYGKFEKEQKVIKSLKIQSIIDNAQNEILIQEKNRKKASDELLLINAAIQRLEKDKNKLSVGICTHCGKSISMQDIEKHQEIINLDINNQIKLKNKLIESIKNFNETINVNIKSKDENIVIYDSIQHEINQFSNADLNIKEATKKYEEDKIKISNDLASTAEHIVKLQSLADNYNIKIRELKLNLPKNISTTEVENISLLNDIQELENKIISIHFNEGKLEQIVMLKATLEDEIKNIKTVLKELDKKLYYLNILIKAFKDIPTTLFKSSVSSIELCANEIIQSILPKFKVKVYEDESKKTRPLSIAFEVSSKYRNYKLLSGGQKTICAVGLRIGFSKIIARKARVSLNFLVLDEIFGFLDEFNRAEMMKILTVLLKHFPQILVITHTGENILFPNLLHVNMDNMGVSTIS